MRHLFPRPLIQQFVPRHPPIILRDLMVMNYVWYVVETPDLMKTNTIIYESNQIVNRGGVNWFKDFGALQSAKWRLCITVHMMYDDIQKNCSIWWCLLSYINMQQWQGKKINDDWSTIYDTIFDYYTTYNDCVTIYLRYDSCVAMIHRKPDYGF